MKLIENQVGGVEESKTVAINSKVQQLISAGSKIYNLSVGEPYLPMHPLLIEAAVRAMQQGKTLYPPVSGIPELRAAACEWMNSRYQCHYEKKHCLVVNGGKFGIYLLLQLALKPGDEVIFASPYWVSYPAIVKLFKGLSCIIETNETENWKLSAEQLRAACNERSKILILNNGANPTGVLYSKQEIADILAVAKEKQLLVISDEVYSGLTYDDHTYVSCGSFAAYQDQVVVIQSASKNFAMTGWRLGFVFAHENIITKLNALVSQSTSGVTTISQWVALAALENENTVGTWIRNEMQKRRNTLVDAFNKAFNLKLSYPASALYLFIALDQLGVSKRMDKSEMTSTTFSSQILDACQVATVPGVAFGKENYVRFSFGVNEADIIGGVEALAEYLS